MKKIMILLLILMVSAVTVFASGNSEAAPAAPQAGRGQGPALRGAAAGETEEVALTGTLVMKDGFPVLSVDGALYSLGGPGVGNYSGDIAEGTVMKVEGTLIIDCGGSCDRDLDGHIFMEKVTVDGQEYTFAPGNGGFRRGGQDTRGRGQRNGKATPGVGNRWSAT